LTTCHPRDCCALSLFCYCYWPWRAVIGQPITRG